MTLYARVLGETFERLPPVLRTFHARPGLTWQGWATVAWPSHPVLRMLALLGGLPRPNSRANVSMCVTATQAGEIWHRQFNGRPMTSSQTAAGTVIRETVGPLLLPLHSRVVAGTLYQRARKARLLGIPLPRSLGVGVNAREWANGNQLRFDVSLFLLGRRLMRYTGQLTCPTLSSTSDSSTG